MNNKFSKTIKNTITVGLLVSGVLSTGAFNTVEATELELSNQQTAEVVISDEPTFPVMEVATESNSECPQINPETVIIPQCGPEAMIESDEATLPEMPTTPEDVIISDKPTLPEMATASEDVIITDEAPIIEEETNRPQIDLSEIAIPQCGSEKVVVATEEPTMPEMPTTPEDVIISDKPTMPEMPTTPENVIISDKPTLPEMPTTPEDVIISDKPTLPEMATASEDVIITDEAPVIEEETNRPQIDPNTIVIPRTGPKHDMVPETEELPTTNAVAVAPTKSTDAPLKTAVVASKKETTTTVATMTKVSLPQAGTTSLVSTLTTAIALIGFGFVAIAKRQ